MDKKVKNYIYLRDGGHCFHCGKQIKINQVNIDHYFPKSKGGTSDYFNLVLSCKKCNKYKKSSVPKDTKEVNVKLFIKAFKDGKIPIAIQNVKQKDIIEIIYKTYDRHWVSEITDFISEKHILKVKKNKIISIHFK